MVRSNAHTLAVPQAALDHADQGSALVFENTSWTHFTSYVGKVERLPAALVDDLAEVAPALAAVRSELRRFGSPGQLRQLLAEQSHVLSAGTPPAMLYGAIVWWIVGMQGTAGAVLSILHAQPELAKSGGRRKESLQWLGKLASEARNHIAPLLDTLNGFRLAIVAANSQLAGACRHAGVVLQQSQEAIGALQVRIEALEAQIAGLGLFGAHKKQDLLAKLYGAQKELARSKARATRLQGQLAALDAILGEGAWLESGIGDLLDAMEQLRTAWTNFGSAMTQMGADTADAHLADPSWFEKALERTEAIRQWEALRHAAGEFVARSLVDFGAGRQQPGWRP